MSIEQGEILISNASCILTMDDRRRELSGEDILIRAGRIVAIGPDLRAPKNAARINAQGCLVTSLLPGLVCNRLVAPSGGAPVARVHGVDHRIGSGDVPTALTHSPSPPNHNFSQVCVVMSLALRMGGNHLVVSNGRVPIAPAH